MVGVRRRRFAVAAAIAALSAAGAIGLRFAGQADGQEPDAGGSPAASPAPVIAPGRPGETASVVPPEAVKAPDDAGYNAHDVQFVRMMIPHHQQGLELAALAPARGGSEQIRAIAERIFVAQEAEIEVLRAWLGARGLAESDPGHADHHGGAHRMPGMQPPEAVAALAAARGAGFDQRFVELMSDHHQGAIDMAREVLTIGADERIQELATAIAAEQSVEIARMRDALAAPA